MRCRALHSAAVHCAAENLPYRKTLTQVTGRRKIHLSTVFAGQYVGMREIADEVWFVSFMDYDLGLFDKDDRLFFKNIGRL
jgi:hypothetical protein